MTRTIEQWEALLENTTPGPWEPFHETWEEYNPDGDAVMEYEQYGVIGGMDGILDTHPVKSLMDAPNQWADSGEHDNAANTRLAAAAPALVDALIAEKQAHAKLRAEVEKLRDWNAGRADYMQKLYEETNGEQFADDSDSFEHTANSLTRILEADDA